MRGGNGGWAGGVHFLTCWLCCPSFFGKSKKVTPHPTTTNRKLSGREKPSGNPFSVVRWTRRQTKTCRHSLSKLVLVYREITDTTDYSIDNHRLFDWQSTIEGAACFFHRNFSLSSIFIPVCINGNKSVQSLWLYTPDIKKQEKNLFNKTFSTWKRKGEFSRPNIVASEHRGVVQCRISVYTRKIPSNQKNL